MFLENGQNVIANESVASPYTNIQGKQVQPH